MSQITMRDWYQRIRRDLIKAKKQGNQSNVKRLLNEEHAYFDAMKKRTPPCSLQANKNQIFFTPCHFQLKHTVKIQYLHETQKLIQPLAKNEQKNNLQFKPKPQKKSNQRAKIKVKLTQKKHALPACTLKNTKKNKINLCDNSSSNIKLRKKLLRKKRKIKAKKKRSAYISVLLKYQANFNNLGKRAPNKCTISPSIIKAAASIFQKGKPSPNTRLDANIPNTGTSNVKGTTVLTE